MNVAIQHSYRPSARKDLKQGTDGSSALEIRFKDFLAALSEVLIFFSSFLLCGPLPKFKLCIVILL